MDIEPPSSVAIQDQLNLFEDATCMSMFNNESLCLELTELQDTANQLYSEVDEYVKEKEAEVIKLQSVLEDRPLTKQQEATLKIKIQKLEAEVESLNKIKTNYERNMPSLIQKTQRYINGIAGGISKKRKVGEIEDPSGKQSVGAQQPQSNFDTISQKINLGISELSDTLQELTKRRASNVDKLDAINKKRGELIKIISDNSDVLEDEEQNRLAEYIDTETQGIYQAQGFQQ